LIFAGKMLARKKPYISTKTKYQNLFASKIIMKCQQIIYDMLAKNNHNVS